MDKERYQTQVAQSITPLVSSTYSYAQALKAAIWQTVGTSQAGSKRKSEKETKNAFIAV